jgi:outer membrane protein assembly factor BamD (BamD/ComL family)
MDLRKNAGMAGLLLFGIFGIAGGAAAAHAQTTRLRTLTYEPGQGEWLEEAPPLPGTPAGDLYGIRRLNVEKKYRAALAASKAFAKNYGEAEPLYPESLLAEAEALIGRNDFDAAHERLQSFLNLYGGMAIAADALRLEFVVAEAYLRGVKRKLWGVFRVSGVDEAYKILDEIVSDHPESNMAELALKAKADHLFRTGEHALAELEYARLMREYGQSRYHPYALRRAADAALASFAGVVYDEAALVEAQERYSDIRVRYGAQAGVDEVRNILDAIRQSRAEKDFRIGEYYERTEHLSSAVFYYRGVCKDWPDTIAAAKAASRLELLGAESDFSPAPPMASR